ncbi:hypothetical protein FPQ18DRAFT_307255 [Pyronema domesticum]|nr:hypothetical protein FPQ18DRAFT_307255 [Pyronema domesticum]
MASVRSSTDNDTDTLDVPKRLSKKLSLISVKSTKHINDTTLSDLSKPSSTTARVQRARILIGNIKKEIHGPDFKKSSSTRDATQCTKSFLGDIRKDIHAPKPSFTSLRSKSASSYTQTIGVPSAESKCREQSIVLIDNSLSKTRNGNGETWPHIRRNNKIWSMAKPIHVFFTDSEVLVSAVNNEVELDILIFKCDKETAKYNASNAGDGERSSYSKGSKSEPAPQPIIKEILRLVDWYRKYAGFNGNLVFRCFTDGNRAWMDLCMDSLHWMRN